MIHAKFSRFGLVAAAACLLAVPAFAQSDEDSADSSAGANIVAPIVIVNDAGLHFGDVVPGATTGTVVLGTGGARSATGGAVLGNPGAAAAAQFTVTGEASATYSVTLPTSIAIDSGANSMTVNTFTHDANGVLTGGTEVFNVGATLQVGANQVAGSYSGTFTVTVTYD